MFLSIATESRKLASAERSEPSAESLAWTFASSAFRRSVFGAAFGFDELLHEARDVESRADTGADDATHDSIRWLESRRCNGARARHGGARCVPAQTRASISAPTRSRCRAMASNSSAGICRTTSLVASLITVITVRPLTFVDLEAQAALRLAHELVQAAATARSTSTASSAAPGPASSSPAACASCRPPDAAGAAGSVVGTDGAGVLAGAAVTEVTLPTITATFFEPPRATAPSLRRSRAARHTTCRPTSRSVNARGLRPASSVALTAAAPARSAEPRWPAPESRYPPAAGSARASAPPSRPRSPRPECGCATPRGSR